MDDLAGAVFFCASDASAYVTGPLHSRRRRLSRIDLSDEYGATTTPLTELVYDCYIQPDTLAFLHATGDKG